jgi:hypothetical protein
MFSANDAALLVSRDMSKSDQGGQLDSSTTASMEQAMSKPEPPEFSFQLFPPKLTARGVVAVQLLAWPVGILLLGMSIRLLIG